MTIHPHAAECPRRQDAPGGRAEQARHLLELAERCEQATSDSFDLNHAIGRALGIASEPFTASLDAAMTLVPEGVQWSIEHYPGCNHPSGKSCATVRTPLDRVAGHTPALALCAAALRARGETL